jgi:pSer/pThr/pTyr-binding forkhead associated (FHA) protein
MNDGSMFRVRVMRNHEILSTYGPASSAVTIGRTEACSIRLDDALISREHAALEPQADGSVLVRDVHSRNGIYFNGKRIKRQVISSDATFDLGGDFQIAIEFVRAEAPAPASAPQQAAMTIIRSTPQRPVAAR